MQVPGVGPSSQPPSNVPTPQQAQASTDLRDIGILLQDIRGDLADPGFSPDQRLQAVTDDMKLLSKYLSDLNSIVNTPGLTPEDGKQINNFFALYNKYIGMLTPTQLITSYEDNPSSWSDAIGEMAGAAFTTGSFIGDGY